MPTVTLPTSTGTARHVLREPAQHDRLTAPATSRVAYAAAHVVADRRYDTAPGASAVLDWDATLRFRHHLWDLGLGVADAMDTAQRGFGLTWEATSELIRRTGAEARSRRSAGRPAPLVCGVATDHLADDVVSLDEVTKAYLLQLDVAQQAGATPVVMASRHLARVANGPDAYRSVYDQVLERVDAPVVLHWLGDAFDPALAGYWGSTDVSVSTALVLDLLHRHRDRVAGIKLSLLDAEHEVRMRRELPDGVRMFCGDDYSYPSLIRGDEQGHSDALLGVFDTLAPVASAALARLDRGDGDGFSALLDPTVPLARHLFEAPTFYYKTGLTFLAWLGGHQDGFVMLAGLAAARGVPHLVQSFRLADELGLFGDPDLAAARMSAFLTVAGVPQ